MPKISIIIPVYNAELYIGKCLESAINQSYQNIEVICVDDGSTDKSVEIIRQYQEKDKRIILLSQNNSGPGVARNNGIDNSSGDLICFLDSDDFLHENAIQKLVETQNRYNTDLVCGKISFFDNNKNETIKYSKCNQIHENCLYNIESIIKNIFQIVSPVNHAKLLSKKILDANSIRYKKYKMAEDGLFIYTYLLHINNLVIIDDIIYDYRINVNNSLTSANSDKFTDFVLSFNELRNEIKKACKFKILANSFYIAYLFCFIHILKNCSLKNKLKVFFVFVKNLL